MSIRLNQFKVLYIFSFHEYLYHRHHYFRIPLPWQRYSLFLSSHPCSCTSTRLGTADNCHCYGTRSGNPLQKRLDLVSKSYKLLLFRCKRLLMWVFKRRGNSRTKQVPNVQWRPFQPGLQIQVPLLQKPWVSHRASHATRSQCDPVKRVQTRVMSSHPTKTSTLCERGTWLPH